MGVEHYFSASPAAAQRSRTVRTRLAGRDVQLVTAGGVFSRERLDTGTRVLLRHLPAPPPAGDVLDLGCGWGPLALDCALQAPHATVWAVDVNRRALDLVRRNAAALGLGNVRAVTPDEVPDQVVLREIRSNPPIRVGKPALHALLMRWIPRLDEDAEAWLVVQRNLGADSLQRWLAQTLGERFPVVRAASGGGYRVLRVRRHDGSPHPVGQASVIRPE